MLYKRSDVNEVMKAIALLKSKALLADDSSMLGTLDAYTCELDWKEEWAFNAHHYSCCHKGHALFINGLPGSFRYEAQFAGRTVCDGRCRTVAECEQEMLGVII